MSDERHDWAIGMGIDKRSVEQLTRVSEEARGRGFDGHLPPGDVTEWARALSAADLEDLADRVRATDAYQCF